MKPCSVFSRSLVNVLSYFHNLKNKNEREKQKKCKLGDFLGGPGVKNSPPNVGDMGLIPGWGTMIPYAMEQLSPRTTWKTQYSQKKKQKKPCELRRCYFNLNAL